MPWHSFLRGRKPHQSKPLFWDHAKQSSQPWDNALKSSSLKQCHTNSLLPDSEFSNQQTPVNTRKESLSFSSEWNDVDVLGLTRSGHLSLFIPKGAGAMARKTLSTLNHVSVSLQWQPLVQHQWFSRWKCFVMRSTVHAFVCWLIVR